MSREQWGNGYAAGYEDGKKGAKEPTYLFTLSDDGFVKDFYIIREAHGNTLAVESFTEYVSFMILTGVTYDFDESIIDYDNYSEINLDEIGKFQMFFSKKAAISFLRNNYSQWLRKKEEQ